VAGDRGRMFSNARNGRPVLIELHVGKNRISQQFVSSTPLIIYSTLWPQRTSSESRNIAQADAGRYTGRSHQYGGRGADIILGGNAEYMARLKLRELLCPWIAARRWRYFLCVGQVSGFTNNSSGRVVLFWKKVKPGRLRPQIFPTSCRKKRTKKLKQAGRVCSFWSMAIAVYRTRSRGR